MFKFRSESWLVLIRLAFFISGHSLLRFWSWQLMLKLYFDCLYSMPGCFLSLHHRYRWEVFCLLSAGLSLSKVQFSLQLLRILDTFSFIWLVLKIFSFIPTWWSQIQAQQIRSSSIWLMNSSQLTTLITVQTTKVSSVAKRRSLMSSLFAVCVSGTNLFICAVSASGTNLLYLQLACQKPTFLLPFQRVPGYLPLLPRRADTHCHVCVVGTFIVCGSFIKNGLIGKCMVWSIAIRFTACR